jgi:hypothetical protein
MHVFLFFIILLIPMSAALADEFSEFRVPPNAVTRSLVRFEFELDSYLSKRTPEDSEYSSSDHAGLLTGTIFRRLESDRREIQIWSEGTLREMYDNYTSSGNGPNNEYSSWSKSRRNLVDADIVTEVVGRLYAISDAVGIEGGATAEASYDSYLNKSNYRSHYQGTNGSVDRYYWSDYTNKSWGQFYSFEFSGGPVFGRRRNVTAIADAHMIEQRLIELGVLSGSLQPQNIARLVDLIYKKDNYNSLYDRPEKYYWQDVEEILKSDPAYVRELDAYSLRRIDEYYVGNVLRYRGFLIRPSVIYSHRHGIDHYSTVDSRTTRTDSLVEHTESSEYNRSEFTSDNDFYVLNIDYYYPISVQWQLNGWGGVLYYPKDTRIDWQNIPKDQVTLSAGLSLEWFMGDKWYARSEFSLEDFLVKSVIGSDYIDESYSQSLSISVNHYLENHLILTAELENRYRYSSSLIRYNYGDEIERWSSFGTNFFLGLTYAFNGSLGPTQGFTLGY